MSARAAGATLLRMGTCHDFGVAIRAGAGRVRLLLCGELDLAGAAHLDRLVDVTHRTELPFILDCRRLMFIDAAGVGSLVRAKRLGAAVEGVRGQVRRVLDLLGLSADIIASVAAPRSPRPPRPLLTDLPLTRQPVRSVR